MQCTCQDIPDGNLNYLIIRLLKLQSSKNNPQSIMTNGKTLKLLMLVSSYPRVKEDNASVFLRHLAESLSNRGIKVHYWLLQTKKEAHASKTALLSIISNIYRLPCSNWPTAQEYYPISTVTPGFGLRFRSFSS